MARSEYGPCPNFEWTILASIVHNGLSYLDVLWNMISLSCEHQPTKSSWNIA
jgi:hypothetical protein